MTDNDKVWQSNIYNSIRDLADINSQRLSWTGKDKENISSFTETLGMLYDSFAFEDYISFYREKSGENILYKLFVELDCMISEYQIIGYELERKTGVAEQILNDVRWIKITIKGQQIIENWAN
ncbi:hypothetical protein [Flavobacterium sp.]|uniref:hypothetical protein n=1 Tax=Flavobacterium sp. TaxID=239 RepID=UPI00263778A7|nr:hypothetical protein [Flavobacterium sp.]